MVAQHTNPDRVAVLPMVPDLPKELQEFLFVTQNLSRAITVDQSGLVKGNSTYTKTLYLNPKELPSMDFLSLPFLLPRSSLVRSVAKE